MNFAFSEEQEELRASVRRFLEDKSPETEVRIAFAPSAIVEKKGAQRRAAPISSSTTTSST